MIEPARLFIDGRQRRGGAGRAPVINPATEESFGSVELAGEDDLAEAIDAAAKAAKDWHRTPPLQRGDLLRRAAAILKERSASIAHALTLEQGKTLSESAGEIARAIETLDWNGQEASRLGGRSFPGRTSDSVRYLVPAPIGVVAAFTAWNFPAVLVTRKVGAALAAGCPVVLKAAEEAPYTASAIVRCLAEAGIPNGVVNLVFGDPPTVAKYLISAPAVRKISFTGSTRVGKELARLAATDLKRCTFELGGHAPLVLAPDGDVDQAVTATIAYKFASAGQSCVSPSRFYVHRSRYGEFAEKFTSAAAALKVGDGLDEGTDMGPLANVRRVAAMERICRDAETRGAVCMTGGFRVDRKGYFWSPTVFCDVPDATVLMTEEPFGPVAGLAPFDDLNEVIQRSNCLRYAFAAYIFTKSSAVAAKFVAEVEAANFGINQMSPSLPDAPLGGLKDSGYGYEGGREGIEAFQHFKLVSQSYLQ